MNIYKIEFSYLEPTSLSGVILAESPEQATEKFKEAIAFDTAPPELNAEITSIELIEENVPVDVEDLEQYMTERKNRVLN